MIVIYFLVNTGNYGYLFWLPSALEKAGIANHLLAGILFAVPYMITGVGMTLNSRHSDKTRERRHHVSFALAFAGICMLGSVATREYAPILSFAFICLVGAGSYGQHGPFWAIPSETLSRKVTGSAIGLINALGNLGGYFGPLLVGTLNKRTGGFVLAFGLLAAGYLVGAILPFFLRASKQAAPENGVA